MITRPLDLAAKLRPAPRSMDALFYVNVVLLGLFFAFFGSRFVLSPGIELLKPDYALPPSDGEGGVPVSTMAVISVLGPDMVFTQEGRMSYSELAAWLPTQVARGAEQESRLLVRADSHLLTKDLMRLSDIANKSGFTGVQLALEKDSSSGFGSALSR